MAMFAVLMMVGVGWVIRAGKLDQLARVMPQWSASGVASYFRSDKQLSPTDYETKQHEYKGAIVGPGEFLDGGRVRLGADEKIFRYWGVRTDDLAVVCSDNRYHWPCGTRAQPALSSYVGGGLVACYDRGTSVRGERMGQCFRGVIDLGGMLVENGLAFEVASETPNYHIKQGLARSRHVGAWSSR